MSAFGSPSPEQLPGRRRTIRATFIATVLIPVASMLVIWALLVAGVLSGALAGAGAPGRAHPDLAGIFAVAVAGLVIILITVALTGLFARRIAADIGGLEVTAEHLAGEQMPRMMEELRPGGLAGGRARTGGEVQPGTRAVTAEAAHAEAAIASLARSAAAAATAEASLRSGLGQVFASLARRNKSLLQRQLRLIDALEQKASDPAMLADLSSLDHLTTRMRRHAEGLLILAGAAPGRSWSAPVPVIDVIRGAVAEIEDYQRVSVRTRAGDAVAGQAVADMIHLLAELIENATLSSPSVTRVEVRAERVANGLAIEVEDRGLGIEPGQLAAINARLASPPDFDLASADQLGLFIVGKLAARHGLRVALRLSPHAGTTAVVLMPDSLVIPPDMTGAAPQPDLRQRPGRDRELDLPAPGAPAPPGRYSAPPGRYSAPPLPVAGTSRAAADGASPAPASRPGLDPGAAAFGTGFSSGPPGPSADAPGPGSLSTRSTPPIRRPGTAAPATTGPATTGPATTGPATTSLGTTGPATTGPAASAAGPPASGPGAAEAAADQGPAAGGEQPDGGTYRGLPRRIRQASLNPHLRRSPPAPQRTAPASPPAAASGRSPEEVRDLVSSLQRGWQRGRETRPAASGPVGGPTASAAEERTAGREADVPRAGEE